MLGLSSLTILPMETTRKTKAEYLPDTINKIFAAPDSPAASPKGTSHFLNETLNFQTQ